MCVSLASGAHVDMGLKFQVLLYVFTDLYWKYGDVY